jgi:hypothetical protein
VVSGGGPGVDREGNRFPDAPRVDVGLSSVCGVRMTVGDDTATLR